MANAETKATAAIQALSELKKSKSSNVTPAAIEVSPKKVLMQDLGEEEIKLTISSSSPPTDEDSTVPPNETITNQEEPQNISTATSLLGESLNNSSDEPISMSIQDMISEIMAGYKSTLEKLTNEVSNLRSEIADQKIQFSNKMKKLNHNQVTIKQDFEQQLKEQQQQQNTLKCQLKQQINQIAVAATPELPKVSIQYETIVPSNQQKQKPKQTQKNQQQSKQTTSRMANAAAGATLLQKSEHAAVSSTATCKPLETAPTHQKPASNDHRPASIQKKVPSAMVFGSSIVRHVNGGALWKQSKTSTKINCYPGAGVQEIAEHTKIRLNHLKTPHPDIAIIHGGGNDLANGMSNDEIITNLNKLGSDLLERGIETIGFSAVTPRTGLKNQVPSLNKLIREMCGKVGNFHFINNSYIDYKYDLSKDKVHLNFDGVWRLEKIFSSFLQKVKEMKE